MTDIIAWDSDEDGIVTLTLDDPGHAQPGSRPAAASWLTGMVPASTRRRR